MQFTGSIANALVRSPFVDADLAPLYRFGLAGCTALSSQIGGVRVLDLFCLRGPTEIVDIVVASWPNGDCGRESLLVPETHDKSSCGFGNWISGF